MAKARMNLRIEESLDHRLAVLAKRTVRSKACYATGAIKGFLDDHEDFFLAKDALAEFRKDDDSAMVLNSDIDWDALGQ